ncbi:MAG TPA: PASTA domain-containing protein [Solirubrobacteraceae bacterium]|nr:PASTA domain-containing protein [Solirubrobacteraceae bacterium]
MRARRLTLLVAAGVALIIALAAGAAVGAAPATVTEQVIGTLTGVGKNQRSLEIYYDNTHVTGCGIVSVTPTVSETSASVDVTLSAQVNTLPPDVACPAIVIGHAITVTLAQPLGGRDIDGLAVRGGALTLTTVGPRQMPSLVGLSPHDARLMLSSGPPPLVGLVTHAVAGRGRGLARVTAQHPRAGAALPTRGSTVTLMVAK